MKNIDIITLAFLLFCFVWTIHLVAISYTVSLPFFLMALLAGVLSATAVLFFIFIIKKP